MNADDMAIIQQSYVVKQMIVYIGSIWLWTEESDLKARVKLLLNSAELVKPGAKLPYYTGYNFKQLTIAGSASYQTLWPIHPAPLFIPHTDYYDIVTSMGGSLSKLQTVQFNKPDSKRALDLMKDLLKHLYGWLLASGCVLNEKEFRTQAMTPSVVQNFILFPLQRTWNDFETTLAAVKKAGLDFIKGFLTNANCGTYQKLAANEYFLSFNCAVIRLCNQKSKNIQSRTNEYEYTVCKSKKLSEIWNPVVQQVETSSFAQSMIVKIETPMLNDREQYVQANHAYSIN